MASVRYEADGQTAVWPIPFKYEHLGQVRVALVDSLGRENLMVLGQDYYVRDGSVVMACAKGCLVIIRLEEQEAPKLVQDGNQTGSLNNQTVNQQTTGNAAGGNQAALDAKLDNLASTVALLAQAVAGQQAALDNIGQRPQALNGDIMVEDARLEELAARLDAVEESDARELAKARALEEDSQIARIRAEGEAQAEAIKQEGGDYLDEAYANLESRVNVVLARMEEGSQAMSEASETALRKASEAQALSLQILERLQAGLDNLEKLGAQYEAGIAQSGELATREMELKSSRALSEIDTAREAALAEARKRASLPGNAWPRGATFTQTQALDQGSWLDLPMPYYPGRASLLIYRDGLAQALDIDYQEDDADAHGEATRVRLLRESPKGSVWSIWLAPTNAAQEASDCALRALRHAGNAHDAASLAMDSASRAASIASDLDIQSKNLTAENNQALSQIRATAGNGLADIRKAAIRGNQDLDNMARSRAGQLNQIADASLASIGQAEEKAAAALNRQANQNYAVLRETGRDYARQAKAQADRSGAYAENSRQWAKNSQAHAQNAQTNSHEAANQARGAWQSAWLAQVANKTPGIAAINDIAQLDGLMEGLYIINPHILRSPTIFMGIWPAQSIADMKWDGLFFIGAPYPDQPAMPPAPEPPLDPPNPPDPDDPDLPPPPENPANANSQWLPCGHSHADGEEGGEGGGNGGEG